jgi:hypothetical protein
MKCLSCNKKSLYNYKGETDILYCYEHKLENMINLRNPRCIYEDCLIQASYNTKGKTNSIYCFKHKLDNMNNVVTKKCIHEGCNLVPSYNYEGNKKKLYCFDHKLDDMVNVRKTLCISNECKNHASFGYINQGILYCSKHKEDNMINKHSSKCLGYNCPREPLYNIKGEKKAIYCSDHKNNSMVIIKMCCIFEDCKITASFNFDKKQKPIYCFEHKDSRMIHVGFKKTCRNEWCPTIVKNKHEGYCLFCYVNMFPDKPLTTNYKTKESAVVQFVQDKFEGLDWVTDKRVEGGCSRRRPDLLLDLGYQIIIIEVDENQHNTYDSSCENKRIMELSQDLGHRPIVFIRFNPDEYHDGDKVISSCWSTTGLCVIKKNKRKEWNERLQKLADQINHWIQPENITEKMIEVVQLFYSL